MTELARAGASITTHTGKAMGKIGVIAAKSTLTGQERE